MIIKSLKLNNFRIYKDSTTINFASGDKNITIIQGNNEVGKTTIMNAITWCLYNQEFYKLEGKKPIWNSYVANKLENGEEDFVEVSLIMEDESQNIVTFKRILNFFKNDAGNIIRGKSSFEITEDDGENTKQFLSTQTYLNKHLPLKLRKYFLFNGEQLENFFNLSKSGNIKDSVHQLSQLNLLKRQLSHLNSIENTHIDKGKDLAPALTKIRNDIKSEEIILKNNTDNYESLDKDKSSFDDEISNLEKQIESIKGDPNKLMKERNSMEEKLDSAIKKKKDSNKKYKQYLLNNFIYIFGFDSLNKFQSIGEDLTVKNYIPADIKKSFLKQLLDNKMCICGEPLEEGSEHYNHIKAMFDDTDPITDIEEEVNALLGSTKVHISEFPVDFKEKLVELKKDEQEYEISIGQLNDRIVEIDNTLENMNIDEISRIQNRLSSLRSSKETTINKLAKLEVAIDNSNKKLEKLRIDEEKESKKAILHEKNERRLTFIKHLKEISTRLIDDISDEIHNKLEVITSELFTEMHWKTIYDYVEISEDYEITVYQKDGDVNSANDLSTGGTLTLALAFTLALNSLSGFKLPIVIDTPMGNLDEDIQMNIAGFLPKYSENKQIILLVKSKEYTKEFRSAIYDNVGEEYKLEFDENQKGITRVKPWS